MTKVFQGDLAEMVNHQVVGVAPDALRDATPVEGAIRFSLLSAIASDNAVDKEACTLRRKENFLDRDLFRFSRQTISTLWTPFAGQDTGFFQVLKNLSTKEF